MTSDGPGPPDLIAHQPLDDAGFARLMAAFEPFERTPRLAVGVSGGSDSLALALLLDRWCRNRGGTLVALTVDHRMRPESAGEARWVKAQLGARGIAQHSLAWRSVKPAGNLQAAARGARYALLGDWCAARGILHLLLAHTLDDQAETLLLRLGRGSGLHGLAAMPSVLERDRLRVLRPLLGCPRDRLQAVLAAAGQDWLDDPSNRDPAYARVRIRRLRPELAREGLTDRRLAETAGHLARARDALARETDRLLAGAVRLDPAGYAWLAPRPLAAAAEEVGLRALARLLATVSGAEYPPRFARLIRLHGLLRDGLTQAATLSGCRILPHKSWLLVVREASRALPVEIASGASLLWDGRFEIRLARGPGPALTAARLGEAGLAALRQAPEPAGGAARAGGVPAPALRALPAIYDESGLAAVPQLDFWRESALRRRLRHCRFAPRNPLTSASFTVA